MYKKALKDSTADNSNDSKLLLNIKDNERENFLSQENYNSPEENDYESHTELINNQNKLFKDYLENLQKCEDKIKIFQTIGYILTALFALMFVIKFFFINAKAFKFYYFLIPSILAVVSFTISLNFFLKLKQLIEKEEEEILNAKQACLGNPNVNGIPIGKYFDMTLGNFLSFFSLNFIALLICTFFILLSLRLEGKLGSMAFNAIFIPLYMSLGIMFFYFIFILPAFIMHKYFWGFVLFASYLTNSVIFLILLSIKIDNETKHTYYHVFIPVFVAVGLHFIYCLCEVFVGENKFLLRILYFISITIFYSAVFYLTVILHKKEYKQLLNVFILFAISTALYSIEKIISLHTPPPEENHEKE